MVYMEGYKVLSQHKMYVISSFGAGCHKSSCSNMVGLPTFKQQLLESYQPNRQIAIEIPKNNIRETSWDVAQMLFCRLSNRFCPLGTHVVDLKL